MSRTTMTRSEDVVEDLSSLQLEADVKSEPSIALAGEKLTKLRKFVPKPKPEISSKLRNILTPKIAVKKRNFTLGTGRPIGKRKPDLSFKYPDDLAIFGYQVMSKAWRTDKRILNLQNKLKDKKAFWQTLNEDINERLFVEDPEKDTRLCILDIDPEYKKIVKARPIKDSISLGSYIECIRELLKTKITLGYREDDLALVDANIRTEQRMVELTNINFQKYVNIFEEFLVRDHDSAHGLLMNANKVANSLLVAKKEYENLKKTLQGLKSSLFKSEARWNVAKLYQKFLYECTPLYWRKLHRNSLMLSLEHKTCLEMFQEINADAEITLTNILETINRECIVHEEEELYFSEPAQIMDMLSYMEQQNFNSLVYNAELQQPLALIKEDMDTAEDHFDKEIKNLQFYIDGLEKEIEWEEERVVKLEALAHDLIFNHFKEIISSPDVLNLHCFVEDIYESVIEPNTANLNVHQMCSLIESHYRNQLFVLDVIPAAQVVELQTATIKQRDKMIILGEQAIKAHAETESALKAIMKGYSPPYEKPRHKPVMFRSACPEELKPPPPPPRELSQKEQEYLEHLTEFCKFYENPRDYGVDTGHEEEKKDAPAVVVQQKERKSLSRTM